MMDGEEELPDSLISALTAARITTDNFAFIRRLTNEVGITSYQVVDLSDRSYVEAARRDGLPALHIYWGYTTGFTTQEEAARIGVGLAATGPSGRPKGTWYVTHPVNNVRVGGEVVRKVKREGGICQKGCGEQLPLTGVCGNCD